MTDTITRQTLDKPSNVAKLCRVFSNRSERIEFEDNYLHYIHPEAMDGLTGLTVRGLKNAQIHFLGKMQGEQAYEANCREDSGVINFVDCQDVRVTNLTAINTTQLIPGTLATESSCVVNVANSRMRFERCRFDSIGCNCLSIHSGSYVEIDDMVLAGYCFELHVASSEVVAARLQFLQDHPDACDAHSAICVHAGQFDVDNPTKVSIDDSVFDMVTGQSLVSGDGGYNSRSTIDFAKITFTPSRKARFGVCAFHERYHSLTVNTDFGATDPLMDKPYLDFVSTVDEGFAKYVGYDDGFTLSRPGGDKYPRTFEDGEAAPILVDGLNSDHVVLP